MHKLIESLQNRPEPVKRLIMWFGVFFVMAVIFTFWLLTFPARVSAPESSEAALNLNKELPGVWQSLKGQFNDLKNLWQK